MSAQEATRQVGADKRTPWTTSDLATLRAKAALGAEALALMLGRSERAVRVQAAKMRISLRRPGVRRGLILGQPRGVRWGSRADTELIREAVLAGAVDPAAVEELLGRLVRGEELPTLCPACSSRYADHRSGVCRVCHLKSLAEAHRDSVAVADAQRILWQARQEASRARRATGGAG